MSEKSWSDHDARNAIFAALEAHEIRVSAHQVGCACGRPAANGDAHRIHVASEIVKQLQNPPDNAYDDTDDGFEVRLGYFPTHPDDGRTCVPPCSEVCARRAGGAQVGDGSGT